MDVGCWPLGLYQGSAILSVAVRNRNTGKQSCVYSGVALIPFQVYSRSGVDPDCSTPWSRIYAARLIPFHWSRGVSFYSGLLQSLIFSCQKVSDFFHP